MREINQLIDYVTIGQTWIRSRLEPHKKSSKKGKKEVKNDAHIVSTMNACFKKYGQIHSSAYTNTWNTHIWTAIITLKIFYSRILDSSINKKAQDLYLVLNYLIFFSKLMYTLQSKRTRKYFYFENLFAEFFQIAKWIVFDLIKKN